MVEASTQVGPPSRLPSHSDASDSSDGTQSSHGSYSSQHSQNSSEDLDANAHILACAAVKYALEDAGLTWFACPDLPDSDEDEAVGALVMLCRCHRSRVDKDQYQEQLDKIDLSEDNSYYRFQYIREQVIGNSEEVSWGRLVALFTFTGDLAVRAMQEGQRDLVTRLADYLGMYLEHSLDAWIQTHGGWTALLELVEERPVGERGWAKWGAGAAAAVVAAGAAALGQVIA